MKKTWNTFIREKMQEKNFIFREILLLNLTIISFVKES